MMNVAGYCIYHTIYEQRYQLRQTALRQN
jgi:hypothetical protein